MDALAKHLPLEKLPSWVPVHHLSQPHVYNYLQAGQGVGKWVDWSQGSLWAAVGMVLFNPIFWNVVARNGELRLGTGAGRERDREGGAGKG